MSAVSIEIKGAERNKGSGFRQPTPQRDNHVADNIETTSTTSWVQAGTTNADTESVIVTNAGPDVVQIAFTEDAMPSRYHVIAIGGQRELFVTQNVPIVLRHP